MLSVKSKASVWGCAACYNHVRLAEGALCSLSNKSIDMLQGCPLAADDL